MATAGTPEVAAGDYACGQFATDDAQAQLVGSFARDAVVRGDRIFYLADRSDETDVVDFLANAGLDGRSMLNSGALHVMHSSELDMEDGFDGARQLSAWRKLTAAARADGYRGLAATAEMSWALSRKVDRDALVAYEASAEPVFMTGELSAICQYDMRVFDRDLLRQAGHAHRYAMQVKDVGVSVNYNRLLLRLRRELELGGE